MSAFLHKSIRLCILFGAAMALGACSQIGIPVENHSNSGYLDQDLPQKPSSLKTDLEGYLKARNLFESSQPDAVGNWYVHQNWVQSPSIRYYLLNFDTRRHHLSEWKVLWYLEPSSSLIGGTKLRIAVLELLYLGDPDDKVRAPREADGNWVETEFDQERAKLLFEDFAQWKKSKKLPTPALYLAVPDLAGPPKIRNDLKRGYDFNQTPWRIPSY